MIHFLGSLKPWFCSYNASTGKLNTFVNSEPAQEFILRWWQTFAAKVHPVIENVTTSDGGIAS